MRIAPLKVAAAGCCAWLIFAGPIVTAVASQQDAGTQRAYQAPIAQTARLQVTGAGDRLVLDVERADVQSTLKAVLKQAGRQFVPDATVTGQVTALLTDQPLETVLRAICNQCYLKYSVSATGIYRFTRDDEAIKAAFGRLKELNVQMRAQLRAEGIELLPDEAVKDYRLRTNGVTLGSAPGGGGLGGGGGESGGLSAGSARRSAPDAIKLQREVASSAHGIAPTGRAADSAAASAKPADRTAALKKDAASKIANIHTDFIPQGDLAQFLGPNSRNLDLQDYSQFVRQNGFVWFNIPDEKPEPVATVLQLFSRQSNTPILVDQSIPSSLKFRVWGNLSPRQLPEALNVLAPTAHLQWRWIGNMIFVMPAPNFMVSYGDQAGFRNAYPAQPRSESNQADTKDRRGGQE